MDVPGRGLIRRNCRYFSFAGASGLVALGEMRLEKRAGARSRRPLQATLGSLDFILKAYRVM